MRRKHSKERQSEAKAFKRETGDITVCSEKTDSILVCLQSLTVVPLQFFDLIKLYLFLSSKRKKFKVNMSFTAVCLVECLFFVRLLFGC